MTNEATDTGDDPTSVVDFSRPHAMTGHENVSKNVIKAVALMKEMKLHMTKLDKIITQPSREAEQAFWNALRDMRECAEDLGDAVEVAWCSTQEECDVANP